MNHNVSKDMFRQLQSTFRSALQEFAASEATFRILNSIPSQGRRATKIETLYVLDSSFNPPSVAHTLLAEKAVAHDAGGSSAAAILLLLATENADKKAKPAMFEDRIAMMTLMAESLYRSTSIPVDIAVTKKPFFMDKAKSIDDDGSYDQAEQVHLIGYDTIVRIFDPKYYPADQKLRVLEPLLDRHRLRVTYRLGGKFGSKAEQDRYVESIGDGSRADEGMKSEWRARIDIVDDAKDGVGVSSTEARQAKIENRIDDLPRYVQEKVAHYVVDMDLYSESSPSEK